MTDDELAELLGRPVDREFRLQLIAESEAEGKPLAQIADKYALPVMAIPDDDGFFEHNGERLTVEQFTNRWPFRKIVVIRTDETIKK